jgi:glucokinase
MIAAIDLGGTRTKFGLVEQGKVVCASSCSADAQGSLDGHLDEVLERLRALGAEQQTTLDDCQGMGVLSTGVVNNREMRVLSTNAKYDDAVGFDFRGWASDQAGLDLRMDNDARGALIGEWRFGAGRGADNLVMMTIGTGIGTAVIVEGTPLTGPHFTAGNLGGHILVRSGGRKCTCGAVGCLESEASGWVLPELVREHPLFGESKLNELDTIGFREVLAHAAAGDACARAVREHCFRLWGEAMVSFIHLLDPERIIVGGGIMNDPQPVLASFRKTVAELAWAEEGQVEIVKAEHPDNAGLIGAAALFSTTNEREVETAM